MNGNITFSDFMRSLVDRDIAPEGERDGRFDSRDQYYASRLFFDIAGDRVLTPEELAESKDRIPESIRCHIEKGLQAPDECGIQLRAPTRRNHDG